MLQGTTQNDIVKEYLSRGTYAFPPGLSMRLIADTVAYTVEHVPKWNPVNVCSYHLQEAGATPVQEIACALHGDRRARRGAPARGRDRDGQGFRPDLVLRQRFYVFVEEHAKLRAMSLLWDELGRERYGVADERARRFRATACRSTSPRADGVPAREQRPADRARGARRHARPQRLRPRDPAAGLERGARAAAAVGPAVVAA